MSSTANSNNDITIKLPKYIILLGKLFQFFSTNLASKYCTKLFITPLKLKVPEREQIMLNNATQKEVYVPVLNKTIVSYHYGTGNQTILVVHGWSGRGTQLVKIATVLVNQGYKIISFDAPAHGLSKGGTTDMKEFIDCIFAIEKEFGPFNYGIGHSLGGMSLINANNQGLQLKKLITIGAADIITDIINNFIRNMELHPEVATKMKQILDIKYEGDIDNYSASVAAKGVTIPTLIIHDENDLDVHVSCAENIRHNLKKGELFITKNLGHRKILGNEQVIEKTIQFITT